MIPRVKPEGMFFPSYRDGPLDPMNFTYSVAVGDPSLMRNQVRVGAKIKANARRPTRHRVQADVPLRSERWISVGNLAMHAARVKTTRRWSRSIEQIKEFHVPSG